jgi:hypothetical protein
MAMRAARRSAGFVALLLAVGVIVAAAFVDVRELAAAFLVAYAAAVSVVLGVLALTLIAHLTTATWFRPFRPRAQLVLTCLPALALVGVLLLLAIPVLYPWFDAANPAHVYLNTPFFIARWVVYWAVWIGIEASLRRARDVERSGDIEQANRRFRRAASAGLPLLALTMTFAAFDWLMSLTPDWQSSIYGVYWFAGGMVAALGLLAVLVRLIGAPSAEPSPDDVHALGKLMLTFILFWVYIGFSQYIVMWSGDLPREVTWYADRASGGWGLVAGLLIFGNFVFPALLLLIRSVKRSVAMLTLIGAALLAMHCIDSFWIVMPGLVPVRWWTVFVTIASLGLLSAAAVAPMRLRRRALPARTLPPNHLRGQPG